MTALKIVDDYKIYMGDSHQLTFEKQGKKTEVKVKQCFPWSQPNEFLSLRDNKGNEVFLIEDLKELDVLTRLTVEEYLKTAEFVMKIEKIFHIEEDVELREYTVLTGQGKRVFHTKLEDWPEFLPDGSILIEDLAGDIFKIEDVSLLDPISQKNLSPYVH
ncbi:MAG: hypothetical protein ACJAT2_002293 [Bacteriovoracaceae bacterium]|jgi:hypothetical protein